MNTEEKKSVNSFLLFFCVIDGGKAEYNIFRYYEITHAEAVIGFGKGVSGLADNKRFVSYMYEYRKDEKLNNMGYARIESRGSQCKVFIHISFPAMEGRLLKAYMFYRKPAKYRFAYLGNVLIINGVGELKVKSESTNVMNSDLALDDMCGIIVYKDNQNFAACEWDDEPVTQQIIDFIENLDLAGNIVIAADTKEAQTEVEDIKQEEPILVVDYQGNPVEEEAAVTQEETIEKQELHMEATEIGGIQEDVEKDYTNHDYYKENANMQEYQYKNVDYQVEERLSQTQSEQQAKELCPDIECIEPTYGICGQGVEPELFAQGGQGNTGKYECHPAAQNIFRRFPRVYPFEDNEISDCVRIEPQDIGLFPIDAWVLGNNSFLLHGYYTYRHLIFGKIKSSSGLIYVLGVPGVYQNREGFMARMFGFEYFKCAKCTEEKNGEFGYYYLPIRFD